MHSTYYLFLIDRKPSVNFRYQRLGRHLVSDYTIVMSRTLKVTRNHVTCNCSANFKGNHVKFARFVLLADLYIFTRLEINYQFRLLLWTFFFLQCIIKQLFDLVFVISRTIKVLVRIISRLSLRLRLITPNSTLIILDITKNLIS